MRHACITIHYMAPGSRSNATLVADTMSWYCFIYGFVIFMLFITCFGVELYYSSMISTCSDLESDDTEIYHGQQRWICEEIYLVKEGETLHTISEKCRDPFIVENNPHIHDPDDVFPGLVIKISPLINTSEF
ncbi:hypothetical protein ACET3Z_018958 [Daucus carota]